MYRPLHTLKLVLPGNLQAGTELDGRVRKETYVWPCGCRAHGEDTEALAVKCCGTHVDLLAQARLGRVSM